MEQAQKDAVIENAIHPERKNLMKQMLYLSIGILLLLSCSTQKEKTNFIGKITLSSGSVDSVYVGLYYIG